MDFWNCQRLCCPPVFHSHSCFDFVSIVFTVVSPHYLLPLPPFSHYRVQTTTNLSEIMFEKMNNNPKKRRKKPQQNSITKRSDLRSNRQYKPIFKKTQKIPCLIWFIWADRGNSATFCREMAARGARHGQSQLNGGPPAVSWVNQGTGASGSFWEKKRSGSRRQRHLSAALVAAPQDADSMTVD